MVAPRRRSAADSIRADYGARIRRFADEYRAGTFDVDAYVRFQMELLAAFPRATLDDWHREFMQSHVGPAVRSAGARTGRAASRAGDELALVTGTNAYVVTPIAREFGIDHVLAVEPEERTAASPAATSAPTPTRTARCARSRSGSRRAAARCADTIDDVLQRFDQRPAAAGASDPPGRDQRRRAPARDRARARLADAAAVRARACLGSTPARGS